ncbi:hypothetical protein QWY85_20000 [Neolewinella lacunae]|uniref:Uncharacterized protein n=1 Tax=Neolewinella lacunae TaxID=1517758 RepID=A0A923TAA8_9BACT|nr:hypothetical protein [Neolewinella lacunae]MBC6996341.1 hypothetical protein [Neolewinella lacunae]MDN3636964.1 hypothetical protein [Neolewinella lacunae]
MAASLFESILSTVKDAADDFDFSRIEKMTGQKIDSVDEFMARTERTGPPHYGHGFLAGMIGGLVGVGVKMLVDRQLAPDVEQIEDGYAEAAVQAAEAFTHIDLSNRQEALAEAAVEFGMGALVGGVYGVVVEAIPDASKMSSQQLMTTTKQLALPALGIAPAAVKDVAENKIGKLAGHVAFAATTEIVRRLTRYYLSKK